MMNCIRPAALFALALAFPLTALAQDGSVVGPAKVR
mgnify:CR=1 FL=1